MACRYINGFDDTDAAGLAYEWFKGSTTSNISIATGRTGSGVKLMNAQSELIRTIAPPNTIATITVGFAVNFASLFNTTYFFFACGDSTRTHVGLQLLADGTIRIYRSGRVSGDLFISGTSLGTSTTAAQAGVWLYIEAQITISDTVGVVKLRFNGAGSDEINLTNQDTNNAGTNYITWIGFGGSLEAHDPIIDDLYVNDTSGTVCTGFMGDSQVDFHLPDADGANSAWTPSTGGTQYGVIDENPANTSDYLSSTVANDITTVSVESFKNGSNTIEALQFSVISQKSVPGSCTLGTVIRESSTNNVSSVVKYPPSSSWMSLVEVYTLSAGDAKRAASGFNSAEYGFKRLT